MVLLGVSGSGRSTLLNTLGGLDVPTAGRVFYRDRGLTIAGEAELTQYRLKGLAPGERVVLYPTDNIRQGVRTEFQ